MIGRFGRLDERVPAQGVRMRGARSGGPGLRWHEVRATFPYQLVKQPCGEGPCFHPGAGWPVSFSLPPKRGVWRAEMTRDLDYSQILPGVCPGVTRGRRVRRTCT
jgi:hypothetical protein